MLQVSTDGVVNDTSRNGFEFENQYSNEPLLPDPCNRESGIHPSSIVLISE